MALPAVVLVLGMVVAVAQVGVAQVRCVDAARAAVRLAARGESGGAVVSRAASIAPAGAAVSAGSSGGEAVVEVRAAVALPLGWRVDVASRAVADVEPATGELP
ncbi:MAG TPA: TadE family type IV pilus minor pilin [Kineosporiaceae bacterium]|nr:TadE family type IV pilus minor pilin [Kineosporiaceae bacterium]